MGNCCPLSIEENNGLKHNQYHTKKKIMANNRVPILASKQTCSGCMVCLDSCPTKALTLSVGNDGHLYPSFSLDKCIGCLKCERTCPIVNKFEYTVSRTNSKPWKAWDSNKKSRIRSTSGGVFAALARLILSKGGVVYGAINEGLNVKHIRIDDIKNLFLLQGSKYLQSKTNGIYSTVKNDLESGNLVLFVGTGCQVAGLLSFIGKPNDRLITIDLICAGVPSMLSLECFCKEENIDPKSISWRNKDNGWKHGLQLTIETLNGEIHKYNPSNSFFGGAFLGGCTNRYSCYDCRFCGINRKSTFTIGDFWGITDLPKEEVWNGVSLLITHNTQAEELLNQSDIEAIEADWYDAISHNFRTVLGKRPLQWLNFERKLLPYAFKHFSYSTLSTLYAGTRSNSLLYWILKIFKYPRYLVSKFIVNRQNKRIISKL